MKSPMQTELPSTGTRSGLRSAGMLALVVLGGLAPLRMLTASDPHPLARGAWSTLIFTACVLGPPLLAALGIRELLADRLRSSMLSRPMKALFLPPTRRPKRIPSADPCLSRTP
jgi:hypothetical protein